MVLEIITDTIKQNLLIVLILGMAIIAAVILIILEIIISKKLKLQKEQKQEVQKVKEVIDKIKKIKTLKDEPKVKLHKLNIISKSFFHEFLGLEARLGYSEMIPKLEKMKKAEYANFCKEMLNEYYSDKNLENQKVNDLISLLIKAITKERGLQIEEVKIKKIEQKPDNLIEKFTFHKNEAHKALNNFFPNKQLMELSRKNVSSKQEALDLLQKNQKVFSEVKTLAFHLKEAHNYFNLLFREKYYNRSRAIKNQLDKMRCSWQSDKQKIFSIVSNPIRQHMISLHLMDKYFKRFREMPEPAYK